MRFPDEVPTLSDGVVTLRAHSPADIDGIVEQCVDPESVKWTTVPHPYQRGDAEKWIGEQVPAAWANDSAYTFAIEAEHHDGIRKFAGSVDLRRDREGVAEIAFGLHPGARGRGVMRRAINLLIDWGFTERGFDMILWLAYVGNWASRKAVWANGFSFDGTIRSYLAQRGERHDAWVGSLRRDDPREPAKPWYVPPVLETERLRLRPPADTDAPRLDELANDERGRHFNGRIAGVADISGERWVHRMRERNATGEQVNWVIADKATDQMLGQFQLHELGGMDDSEAQPGYGVHPDARGKGLATEALNAVCEWAFRPVADGGFGKRRLTISTAESNTASRHAADRAGFTHVASIPTGYTIGETGFEDEVIYSLINENWSASSG
ncbi:RimJ/RimL family protein N-acetyltransferase [Herbihabitans rhizosphaerae]|uniref:RimJ/RimL family protein N-acetyltransferase n=1 Tax=Herbihabitans rhizosphaerae TaxID=1872711 RepID=A0A4Q7KAT4_9PSEU|nr:GNAT family N-acetyltransferase [Herbihabitans rhizosphaerae]RZS29476.1 RimJ/RimL family protein N-acetyltransferase [Herbihabitans rhizosphaerae]